MVDLSEETGERIALTDAGGALLVDSAILRFDEDVPLPVAPSALIDPLNPAVKFNPPDEYFDALWVLQESEFAFADCLERSGVPFEIIHDEDFEYVIADFDDERAIACDAEVAELGLFDDFDEFPDFFSGFGGAEPALLFLGELSTAGGALLGSGLDRRLLLAIAAILAPASSSRSWVRAACCNRSWT